MNSKSFKKAIVVVLLAIGLFIGYRVVAYWAEGVIVPDDNKVDTLVGVSTAGEVITTLEVDLAHVDDKQLIPHTIEPREFETNKIDIAFDVIWKEAEDSVYTFGFYDYEATIEITYKIYLKVNLETIDDQDEQEFIYVDYIGDLFNLDFDLSEKIKLSNEKLDRFFPYQINVVLTMDEPFDEAEYDYIAGQTIKIEFTVSVIPPKVKE